MDSPPHTSTPTGDNRERATTSYKQSSLIPGEAQEAAAQPEPAKTVQEPSTPIAPQSPAAATESGWIVTAEGLESANTAGDPPVRINYVIEKERLLQVAPGTAGVSDWAMQLAGKSWLPDPNAMVDKLEEALDVHHPRQTVIDIDTTRAHALREWQRTRRRPDEDDDLGYEYVPGEPTLRALARREPEVAASRLANSAETLGPYLAWLEEYPDGDHDLLRRHGVDPAVHPDAHAFNLRLLEAAASGLTGDALAEAADQLGRAYILEEERGEDLPAEAEWEIERQVDESRG